MPHTLTRRYCAEAKMKHKQRELLAYIELESGTVLIDIVKRLETVALIIFKVKDGYAINMD